MKKLVLVILGFYFLIFSLMFINYQNTGHFANSNDYFFHLELARGNCFDGVNGRYIETCKTYPPVLKIISGIFSSTEILYNTFLIGILCILIPVIIVSKTKSVWSVLIYFSSSLVYTTLYGSIFAQMLIFLLVVVLLFNEKFNPLLDIAILFLSYFVHNEGIFATLPIIIYKIFNDRFSLNKGFWLTTLVEKRLDFSSIFKLGPLINWFYTLKLEFPKILLIGFFLISGFIFDFRTILFIPIFWAYWLPKKIDQFSQNNLYKFVLYFGYSIWTLCELFIWFRDIYSL